MQANPALTLTAASWQKITKTWRACSSEASAVEAGLGGRSIDALQVIEMPGQSDAKAVFRALWLLARTDRRTAVYLAMKAAEHVLPIFEKKRPADKRPRQCLATIKRWLAGKATAEELRKAAYAAAAAAAAYAAAAAAYAAAAAADDAAAYAAAAADDAAYAAAAAADDAAYAAAAAAAAAYAAAYADDADAAAAERKWQRAMITRELQKIKGAANAS